MANTNMKLKIYTVKFENDLIVKIQEQGNETSVTMSASIAAEYMRNTSEQALAENIRIHWAFI